MQQFQVPQFITVEDRIIGPLTLKQFFYLLGAAGALLLAFVFLPTFLFIIAGVPLALAFAALAFGKMGDRPLPTIASNALTYFTKPRLYLWHSPAQSSLPLGTTTVSKSKPGQGTKLNDLLDRIHSSPQSPEDQIL